MDKNGKATSCVNKFIQKFVKFTEYRERDEMVTMKAASTEMSKEYYR